jgi:DNA (cytosine-5)-methyltransferase 1
MRTVKETSEIMRQIHSKDTTPDILFRKALWAQGFRYKLYDPHLPGKPDLILPSKKVAVFVDGDFWHGNQWKLRGFSSLDAQFVNVRNKEYWVKKIRKNMDCDCRNTKSLLLLGWTVLRFWESEIRDHLDSCIDLVVRSVSPENEIESMSLLLNKTFNEFFAGIGLMRMGLEKCGWSVCFANDIDPLKHQMYKHNYPRTDGEFIVGDIHKVAADLIPSSTIATASFPCNDLSLAGAREGLKGKQSSAYWGFVRIIEDMQNRRPPILLIENVPGFLTANRGEDLEGALLALNNLGYVIDMLTLDASNFVPQSRQRLFIIGLKKSLFSSKPLNVKENYQFYGSNVRPKAIADFILLHPTIEWKLRDLPNQPSRARNLDDIVEDIKDDSNEWWNESRVNYLLNQMSEKHRELVKRMMSQSNYSYGTVFRRVRKGRSMAELRTDKIAGCLRTPRGGSGRQILLKAGNDKCYARLINPRECARLMGADDYKIDVGLNQALFGFGDAVCVPVIEWIANYYLNPLINELIRGVIISPVEVQNEVRCK